MLRKSIIAGAASLLLAAGTAYAAESCFPSATSDCGPAAGEAPTTSYDRALPSSAGARGDCFPTSASECGPVAAEAPTTSYERPAVGATRAGAAGAVMGPVEVMTPGLLGNIDD